MDDLIARIDKLLDPQLGICRGVIRASDKPHDRPDTVVPTKLAELDEIADVLRAAREQLS